MRVVGAVVLVVLGVQALRTARRGGSTFEQPGTTATTGPTGWQSYRTGLVANVTNPKIAVFSLSFLPQFVPAGFPVSATLPILAVLWGVVDTIWYTGVIWCRRPGQGTLRTLVAPAPPDPALRHGAHRARPAAGSRHAVTAGRMPSEARAACRYPAADHGASGRPLRLRRLQRRGSSRCWPGRGNALRPSVEPERGAEPVLDVGRRRAAAARAAARRLSMRTCTKVGAAPRAMPLGNLAATSSLSVDAQASAMPNPLATADQIGAEAGVAAAACPVSPKCPLSSTTIVRFVGCLTRDRPRLPMPISCSPSPVITTTGLSGCASAGPDPARWRRPSRPRGSSCWSRSPAANTSYDGEPEPGDDQGVGTAASSSATNARGRSARLLDASGSSLALPLLAADQALVPAAPRPARRPRMRLEAGADDFLRPRSGFERAARGCPSAPAPPACAAPIGPCHGLNSAYSPRIVTSVKKGKSAAVAAARTC